MVELLSRSTRRSCRRCSRPLTNKDPRELGVRVFHVYVEPEDNGRTNSTGNRVDSPGVSWHLGGSVSSVAAGLPRPRHAGARRAGVFRVGTQSVRQVVPDRRRSAGADPSHRRRDYLRSIRHRPDRARRGAVSRARARAAVAVAPPSHPFRSSAPLVPYGEIIDQVSARHGVPAGLVRAVIKVESAYREGARSRKGAMGLMQLMPATARHTLSRTRTRRARTSRAAPGT